MKPTFLWVSFLKVEDNAGFSLFLNIVQLIHILIHIKTQKSGAEQTM